MRQHERPALDIDQGRQARQFGLMMAAVLTAIGLWQSWHGHRGPGYWLGGGAVFCLLALARASALLPALRAWLAFGNALHRVVNPLLMAMLYTLAVVPTGLLMRLVGKDPLRLKIDREAASYWIHREASPMGRGSMNDQF
jgi:hypothetical protein